ncbi:hypothetical protein H6504_02215 [Candidatus Woesearchaeota archaeon]|nr:hypothetical protein [Candidatus Woesearchaeota archaeon]
MKYTAFNVKSRRYVKNILATIVVTILLVTVLELFLRGAGWYATPEELHNESWIKERYAPGFNQMGCRGTYRETVNQLKILVVGDSYTYGYGILQEETYPSLLEASLNNTIVYNCGYPGRNFEENLDFLHRILPKIDPDIVIFQFLTNDLASPVEIDLTYSPSPYYDQSFITKHSHLVRLLYQNTENKLAFKEFYQDIEKNYQPQSEVWKNFTNRLHELEQIARKTSTIVVVMDELLDNYPFRDFTQLGMQEFCSKNLTVIDMYEHTHNIPVEGLKVSSLDPHPNKDYNQAVVDSILSVMRNSSASACLRESAAITQFVT